MKLDVLSENGETQESHHECCGCECSECSEKIEEIRILDAQLEIENFYLGEPETETEVGTKNKRKIKAENGIESLQNISQGKS